MANNLFQMAQPSSTNVHSNIDSLILKADLDRLGQTGLMYTQPESPRSISDVLSRDFAEGLLPIGAGIKLFRGVPRWFRGSMVKSGKHVSPTQKRGWSPWDVQEGVWASTSKKYAEEMAETTSKKGMVLEFEVPDQWWEKASLPFRKETIRRIQGKTTAPPDFYRGGIPKEYLKKVHKGFQGGGVVQNLYSMI